MLPTLADGDLVFVQAVTSERLVVGDVVVAHHPLRNDAVVIKRLVSVDGDRLHLAGDNPGASTDSRTLGALPAERLIGRVTAHSANS